MAEKEYIEREAAKKKHCEICLEECICYRSKSTCGELKAFDLIPAADVRPVVRSRWKYIEYYPEGHDYKCQHCRFKNAEETNYCPSCGAVMMGVET